MDVTWRSKLNDWGISIIIKFFKKSPFFLFFKKLYFNKNHHQIDLLKKHRLIAVYGGNIS